MSKRKDPAPGDGSDPCEPNPKRPRTEVKAERTDGQPANSEEKKWPGSFKGKCVWKDRYTEEAVQAVCDRVTCAYEKCKRTVCLEHGNGEVDDRMAGDSAEVPYRVSRCQQKDCYAIYCDLHEESFAQYVVLLCSSLGRMLLEALVLLRCELCVERDEREADVGAHNGGYVTGFCTAHEGVLKRCEEDAIDEEASEPEDEQGNPKMMPGKPCGWLCCPDCLLEHEFHCRPEY